ncbi:Histone deacetylase HDA1 [Cladophialophora carrionii]|uniref:histone deacetylase n=1 Tax=Cladophialophora carrionii TaxID=86049 RepID=A0A1C1C7L6_9EURO|nr:Histone deacetylase HDA1 [Cladophialophora carrionii]
MAPKPPSPPGVLPQAANGPRFANPIPQLPEQALLSEDISMRETPDMSGDINSRLRIESPSDDTSEDSLMSDSDSEPDETLPKSQRGLPISRLPTGLCYDDRMRYHAEVAATSAENVHPEDPRRIYYIFKELCEAGLVDDKDYPPMVEQPLKRIDAREATKEEILLIHDEEEHYNFVRSTAAMSNAELIDLSESAEQDSIYFNQLSFFSGKLSAGAAIETCKAVLDRKVKNAIAVIRPPGHHAEPLKPMGFCLFNNVCIASKACQIDATLGQECRKILIVDWDVHHGNGGQRAFYNDPNVLYISIHVHMNGQFYPSGPEGDMYHCGEGPGLGKNVNIPWPSKGMGDGDYMYAFQSVVMPIAVEFDPDFVIVAAGFDAAAGDELGGCFVTPACYAHMTHMLMSLAGGKIAVCLEGGYNFGAISKSALAVTRTLMGEPPDRLQATAATSSAIDTISKVRNVQSKYWRSIYPKEPVAGIFGGERLHGKKLNKAQA